MAQDEAYRRAEQKIEAARQSGSKELDLSVPWSDKKTPKLTELGNGVEMGSGLILDHSVWDGHRSRLLRLESRLTGRTQRRFETGAFCRRSLPGRLAKRRDRFPIQVPQWGSQFAPARIARRIWAW
jgi:hypothetical protein